MALSLALVGCGAMGSALLKGWLTLPDSRARFKNFWVVAPHRGKVVPFLTDDRVAWYASPKELPATPDLIFFAVKPALLADILPNYASFETVFVSVASGKSLDFYGTYLAPAASVVRAMPNLPLSIHQGVVGLLTHTPLSSERKQRVEACFQGMGFSFWVASDDELDRVTALTGSGPAYVFYMMEGFAKAAEALGFSKEVALQMALYTFEGAASAAQKAHESPESLRRQVTSPQGTTAEAIKVFEKEGLQPLMEHDVRAAYRRAKELST